MMDWSYVAGFFDGEGSIGAYPPPNANYCWGFRITIAQKRTKVLLRMQEFLLMHGIKSKMIMRQGAGFNKKDLIGYLIFGRFEDVLKFLLGIRPYSIVKKTIVEDCLRIGTLWPMKPILQTLAKEGRSRSRITECRNGHPYDKENTHIVGGRRRCRTCLIKKHRIKATIR